MDTSQSASTARPTIGVVRESNDGERRVALVPKIVASLIALSVLAGIATSAVAQTKDDEDRGDFWRYQERNLP